MNLNDRQQRFEAFSQECLELLKSKSRDYEPSGVAYAKIRSDAEVLGMTPNQLFGVFMSKHYSAIQSYIKHGQLESEPIRERLKDLVNYCFLLAVLIEEAK